MCFPLTILDDIADHAEYARVERNRTNGTQNRDAHRHCHTVRIGHQNALCNNNENRTCQRQIALTEAAQQYLTEQNTADNNDHLDGIHHAVQLIVAQNILAEIRCGCAEYCIVAGLYHPQNGNRPEILVGEQSLQILAEANVALFCSFNVYALLAVLKAQQQQNNSNDCPNAHGLDPCHLIRTKYLDERQSECHCNDTSERRHCHAENAEQITSVGRTRHHCGHRAIRQVYSSVQNRCHQIVCDKDVPELQHWSCLRHHHKQNSSYTKRNCHPQNPRTRLAPLGICLADNNAHDEVGNAVQTTRNNHNQTDRHRRNANVVGIKQSDERCHQSIHNVTRYVTESVTNFLSHGWHIILCAHTKIFCCFLFYDKRISRNRCARFHTFHDLLLTFC